MRTFFRTFVKPMNIVAFRTLRAFYEKHEDCEAQLKTWYKKTVSADWKSPKEIKSDYLSASILEDNRVVFNIKGNEYRLIIKFNYKYGWSWVRFIGTHAEYHKIDTNKI